MSMKSTRSMASLADTLVSQYGDAGEVVEMKMGCSYGERMPRKPVAVGEIVQQTMVRAGTMMERGSSRRFRHGKGKENASLLAEAEAETVGSEGEHVGAAGYGDARLAKSASLEILIAAAEMGDVAMLE